MNRIIAIICTITLSLAFSTGYAHNKEKISQQKIILQNTHYSTLLDAIKHQHQLSEFYKLIRTTKLEHYFKDNQPITILAPDNNAFKKFPHKLWKKITLKAQRGELSNLLRYHIISSNISNLQTYQGGKLKIAGAITFDSAKTLKIMQVDNSSLITIDKVLLPPSDWIAAQLQAKKKQKQKHINYKKENSKK